MQTEGSAWTLASLLCRVAQIDRGYIVGRWLEYEGESRANVLRLIAIAAFYVVELVNYHGLNLGVIEMPAVVDRKFHLTVTSLAVAWTLVGLIVLYCQVHHYFPGP